MSLTQLEYFVTVAEEAHVGRAAKRLRVASRRSHVRSSGSKRAGVSLFERNARGMKLLPKGERFLVHARTVLDAVERARVCTNED